MTAAPDTARLRSAVKGRDTWWAHYVIAPLANRIVAHIATLPIITPNRVTLASLWVGLLGAACFADGRPLLLALGGVVLQLSFVLDCVDGQLARYRGASSLFGSMLDRVCDRLKLFAVTLALCFGVYARTGEALVFVLGLTYFFGEYMLEVYIRSYRRLVDDATPRPGTPPVMVARIRDALRVLDLPIVRLAFADRYFLISLLAVLNRPGLLLVILAGLGAAQALLRPLYYTLHLRCELGYWLWNDERAHALGENL